MTATGRIVLSRMNGAVFGGAARAVLRRLVTDAAKDGVLGTDDAARIESRWLPSPTFSCRIDSETDPTSVECRAECPASPGLTNGGKLDQLHSARLRPALA